MQVLKDNNMPIRTTANDVILVGHGSYQGGAVNFQLPAHVELHLLQPVGAAMTDGPVKALVGQRPIDRLILWQTGTGADRFDDLPKRGIPTVYSGPTQVPDLVLHDLGDLKTLVQSAIAKGPNHVIMVTKDTRLSQVMVMPDIQKLIAAAGAAGSRLRVFWAACAVQSETDHGIPSVYCNGLAIAAAVSEFARHNPAAVAAKKAAFDYAKAHPDDTAGVLAAAIAKDPAGIGALTTAL
jgi:hypothetical protein